MYAGSIFLWKVSNHVQSGLDLWFPKLPECQIYADHQRPQDVNPNLFEGCDSMVGFPAAAACPCKSGPDLFLLGLKMQRKARMMLVTVDCSGYSRP